MTNPDQPDLFARQDVPSIRCTKCPGKAWLTPAREVYRNAPLGEYVYWCRPCDTRVGCHGKTTRPLGTPADAELRRMRELVHKHIDPIWKADLAEYRKTQPHYNENKAQTKFYQRLATAMQLNENDCHVAKFDLAKCQRALELARSGALERRRMD